ncbi:MAG: citramalate synthase [Firmicutes bacterium HGW-Firmicutes-13]|nr:MAG: citramalate synthase [Firmicutes bacterium HGW-Firmicutes-13]
MTSLQIYDTTLRDGSQREGISFSVSDKIKITQKLDDLGISYVEGGWPGSNPKDIEYFKKIKEIPLKKVKVTAFGSTRKPNIDITFDPNIEALLSAQTKVITIFGKSWDFQVTNILGTTLKENLDMISDTIRYLKNKKIEVIYDAEHFFDGYKNNSEYALSTLEAAQEAGADIIVLCDTNGGLMPLELMDIITRIKKKIKAPLGIHAHNDSGMAAANSIIAAQMGLRHIQGTINGYGERCGNANLCTIIPNLKLKMNLDCIDDEDLKKLTKISRYISELANLSHQGSQPFVGSKAFAHKAGVHVSAVSKYEKAYEHINPEKVGNERRILVSELSGKSNVLYKARENNIELNKDHPETKEILKLIKELEYQGYQFEGAEGSFELLIWKALNSYRNLFELEGFRVIVEKRKNGPLTSEATIKLKVDNHEVHTASEGNGPVNALDNALRKALEEIYPEIKNIKLVDYKVRVLDGQDGTGSKVRVLIESSNDKKKWGTVGVSPNIIEASWIALVDSIEYGLLCKKIKEQKVLLSKDND